MRRWSAAAISVAAVFVATGPAFAGEADIVDVKVQRVGPDTYAFAVTVRHADSGWDHYADRWEVLAPDSTVLATRELAHPHVDEQPFTRLLDAVRVPSSITRVRIRTHDKVHGFGGAEQEVDLPQAAAAPTPPASGNQ